ncbi:MAG: zf-HC2 domain-containing protein [Streptosporangiaceae bacterium]
MTDTFSTGHSGPDLLARYAAGSVDEAAAWSVEAHLMACAACRSGLAAQVDAGRLARNRSVLLVRAAIGDDGRAGRLLRRCGVPDHLVRLLAATPSLRRSWLLSVAGVLAVVTGEAVLARYGWGRMRPPGSPGQEPLVPFLLAAPLLPLASVAAAFMPVFDPAYRLAVAAPLSGFRLLLVRAVCALAAAVVPVACAAFAVPGPGWLPAAFLLPSLAVCGLALAAVTVMRPLAAAVTAGTLWTLAVLALAGARLPLLAVQWHGQAVCAAVLLAATAVVYLRHDRFELEWMR